MVVLARGGSSDDNPFKLDTEGAGKLADLLKAKSEAATAEVEDCQLCGLDELAPDPALPLSSGARCPFKNGMDCYCRVTKQIRNIKISTQALFANRHTLRICAR